MQYRRFGRTNLQMPVYSCGGMRYQQSWQDQDPDAIEAAGQANLEATIRRALELGINHIETARGYGSSEMQLGRILPTLPRDQMIVQTKVGPEPTAEGFRDTFETSMKYLQLDYVDLLGVHGINNQERLEWTLRPGGCLDVLEDLRAAGRIRHVGFSTHGATDVILDAVNSGRFDYVNFHWYYFDQRNAAVLEAATRQDMGIFIISPNDKGGKLYAPPPKLVELCRPLHPMVFNALFCLADPRVHTLSCGAARPTDFDAHLPTLALLDDPSAHLKPIIERLVAAGEEALGSFWFHNWHKNLPNLADTPGEVNLYHALRLFTLAKDYDMHEFGKMRYNLLGNADHWFPGNKVDKMDWQALPVAIAESPVADQIPDALRAADAMLAGDEQKRLSESAD